MAAEPNPARILVIRRVNTEDYRLLKRRIADTGMPLMNRKMRRFVEREKKKNVR